MPERSTRAATRRVLVLSPHPDDDAIGCGGTLRRHALDGDEIRVVFLTSGEHGCAGSEPGVAVAIREEEARRAGRILGVGSVEFWRQPDGRLRASKVLRKRLASLVEEWRPDVLYVTHGREAHPDHRAAARLVRSALAAASWKPHVRMYEVWSPLSDMDEIVDITPFIDGKIEAIRAHASQCAVMKFDEAARSLSRYRGEMHCWPDGDYAEVFTTLRL